MTDIVERLRRIEWVVVADHVDVPRADVPIDDLCNEAADEIERLRRDNAVLLADLSMAEAATKRLRPDEVKELDGLIRNDALEEAAQAVEAMRDEDAYVWTIGSAIRALKDNARVREDENKRVFHMPDGSAFTSTKDDLSDLGGEYLEAARRKTCPP